MRLEYPLLRLQTLLWRGRSFCHFAANEAFAIAVVFGARPA